MRLYVKELERLDAERGRRAIMEVIRSQRFLPSVSEILDAYRQQSRPKSPPELDEPPLTEEQRLENVRRIRALMQHASENWNMDNVPRRYRGGR